ncbi:MAG: DUF1634 domain-containing protein [Chlorobiaceae bacterium]|nr:DUF1634 domain-containing protein [Chlorobiaceae bacterium]NTW73279.1 DUF1634 domain-containing protein [Chlorobiaceae bacterium]
MTEKKKGVIYADRVQLTYAKTLEFVSHSVIVVMAVGYLFYLLQLLPLGLPIETIAGNWHLSSAELHDTMQVPCGWSCFSSLSTLLHGDSVSYASVVFLAMATTLCLATAIWAFFSEKNYFYAAMATLQVVVLLLAASGIFSSGR